MQLYNVNSTSTVLSAVFATRKDMKRYMACVVSGEAVTAVENLSSDATIQESCTVVSDYSIGSQQETLLSSGDHFATAAGVSVTAPVVTDVTVVNASPDSVSTLTPSKVQESILTDSTRASLAHSTAVSLSSSLYSATSTASGNIGVLENTAISGNSAQSGSSAFSRNPIVSSPQTMTVSDYCQAFEQWTWQYYWWMQHVQWMTWAAYMSTPMYAGASCIPSTVTQSMTQAAVTSVTPAARAAAFHPQQQMQQPRGNTAYLVDLCCFTST